MNIVIVGAGNTGRHLAALLSKQGHNVLVIDQDKNKVEQLGSILDVAVRVGTGNDWQLLDEILETDPDLFIALTNDDDTNLVACSLAKQLGYPETIARVHDNRFLNRTRLDFGRVFDVDHFICPELLAAHGLLKNIVTRGALGVEYFSHGAVQLRTIKIPSSWQKVNVTLSDLNLPQGVMVGLIYRVNVKSGESKVIFPHGQDVIIPGDEVTLIGESDAMDGIPKFFSLKMSAINSCTIIGGSLTAYHLARLLEKRGLGVKIIEKDRSRAIYLADHLPRTSIINHDALDLDFLRSEKIDQADLVAACSSHDDFNLLAALLARQAGAENVLMILSNQENAPILDKLDIPHSVSPIVSSCNRILSQVVTGAVNTLITLYDNQAEVFEITVSGDSKMVGIPISDLGPLLPKDFLIAIIQNRGRIMVAHGGRILSPGDTVIVIASPKEAALLEKIF